MYREANARLGMGITIRRWGQEVVKGCGGGRDKDHTTSPHTEKDGTPILPCAGGGGYQGAAVAYELRADEEMAVLETRAGVVDGLLGDQRARSVQQQTSLYSQLSASSLSAAEAAVGSESKPRPDQPEVSQASREESHYSPVSRKHCPSPPAQRCANTSFCTIYSGRMGCFDCICIAPSSRRLHRSPRRVHHHHSFFWWPNFTFSRSHSSLNPRRIHSTFSLRSARKPKTLRRRHTTHTEFQPRKPVRASSKPAASRGSVMSDQYAPPPGPPPGHDAGQGPSSPPHVHWGSSGSRSSELASNNPFRDAHQSSSQGMPQSEELPPYDASNGPPPGWQGEKKDYPPSGPPPNYQQGPNNSYAPPPGPPPPHDYESEPSPPPYDPWLAVPDSTLLPPPPSLHQEFSPSANASEDDARRGHSWCRQTPLLDPMPPQPSQLQQLRHGEINLTTGPNSRNATLINPRPGNTHIRTTERCSDTCFLSSIPLYFSQAIQHPLTIYYEVHIIGMGHGEGEEGISLGFLAPPYPDFRLPGWHRASIGVHGDDGHRYCDDSYGGKDFTEVFRNGDVVGIGMVLSPAVYQGGRNRVECFFTRNGRKEGGWDLFEERDAEEEGGNLDGLGGGKDILAAVGAYGKVEFEARFKRDEWLFRP